MAWTVGTYCSDGDGELAHRVEGGRASVDELLDEGRELGTGSPFTRESSGLFLSGNLAREKEPEEGFRKGLLAAGCSGKGVLALGDGLSTEADTLVWVG